jgi:hypothetical protein
MSRNLSGVSGEQIGSADSNIFLAKAPSEANSVIGYTFFSSFSYLEHIAGKRRGKSVVSLSSRCVKYLEMCLL